MEQDPEFEWNKNKYIHIYKPIMGLKITFKSSVIWKLLRNIVFWVQFLKKWNVIGAPGYVIDPNYELEVIIGSFYRNIKFLIEIQSF